MNDQTIIPEDEMNYINSSLLNGEYRAFKNRQMLSKLCDLCFWV